MFEDTSCCPVQAVESRGSRANGVRDMGAFGGNGGGYRFAKDTAGKPAFTHPWKPPSSVATFS